MIEEILTLIENKEFVKLRSTLSDTNAPDIAIMLDEIPEEYVLRLFRLLPKELENKCVCINNSSLLGTVKYVFEKNDVKTIAEKTEYIDLSADAFFSDMFIENMMF